MFVLRTLFILDSNQFLFGLLSLRLTAQVHDSGWNCRPTNITLDLPTWRSFTFFCAHCLGSHNSRTWTRFQSFICLFQVNG